MVSQGREGMVNPPPEVMVSQALGDMVSQDLVVTVNLFLRVKGQFVQRLPLMQRMMRRFCAKL
jgi:hypothetical protein